MDLLAPDAHDVEDFLSSLMDQEFDTIVDDGSIPEVSRRDTPVVLETKNINASINCHRHRRQGCSGCS